MPMLKNVLHIIQQSELSLPALEVVLLVSLLSLSLVFRYNRFGIMTAYLFAYRWGWLIARSFPSEARFGYIVLGILVGVLSVAGMLCDRES